MIILVGAVVIASFLAIICLIFFKNKDERELYLRIIEITLLLITGIFMYWQVDEAIRARQQSVQLFQLEAMPFLDVSFGGSAENLYEISNKGKGVALNVSFLLFNEHDWQASKIVFLPNYVSAVAVDKNISVPINFITSTFSSDYLRQKYPQLPKYLDGHRQSLVVVYEDIYNNKFCTIFDLFVNTQEDSLKFFPLK